MYLAYEFALFLSRSALQLAREAALVFYMYYGVASTVLHIERKLSLKTKVCIAISSVTKTNSCLPPPIE